MRKVWLWGAGKYLNAVKRCINKEVEVIGIFDNASELVGQRKEGLIIYSPRRELIKDEVVIITALKYKDIYPDAVKKLGVNEKQIVSFFDDNTDKKMVEDVVDIEKWKDTLSLVQLEIENEGLRLKLQNYVYEIAKDIKDKEIFFPMIEDGKKALKLVIENKMSMCRFGDGEFELISGRNRPFFQKVDLELGKRLRDVLVNKEEKLLTCIADNYGSLEKYTESAARNIRIYMTDSVRQEHLKLIDRNKTYYDAYVSRPYILYKNRDDARCKFELWKQVWENRKLVLVEGELSRSGVGNDLFAQASSIKRILCPAEHAWGCYEQIYQYILQNVSKDSLICIALGPTATVLAYDLCKEGYQAIDMGHLDNEYEWYLRNAQEIEDIRTKYVNDYSVGRYAEEICDVEYEKQIIIKVRE